MIIQTENLTKAFGSTIACDNISIQVQKGSVHGFLGPNGAGKSTFVKMLTGLVFPTSGQGAVLGRPLGDMAARTKMGYLPELFRYQDWMTATDLLAFHAKLCRKIPLITNKAANQDRFDDILKLVGLYEARQETIGAYSKGMQQRAGLACALLSDPELLFLDEPTSALDPIGRKDVRDIIHTLKQQGITVFLNSHLLGEVESVCDHITIINHGAVVKSAPMEELLTPQSTVTSRIQGLTGEALAALTAKYPTLTPLENHRFSVEVQHEDEVPAFAADVIAGGGALHELTSQRETLESVFLKYAT